MAPDPASPLSAGRSVLVVGASSGIGRAVAHQLAARGDRLVLSSRSKDALEEVVRECQERGARSVRAAVCDVRHQDSVEQVVRGVVSEHGRLDAVVSTAAVLAFGRFEDVPPDVFDEVVRTNVLGAANVARAALPVLRSQGAGTLVLLGSLLGETAAPDMTPYVVSKWAVRSLGRQLEIENRDVDGVRVCVVAPGAVDTPIYKVAGNYEGREVRAPFPVSRPEQVARAVVGALDRPRTHISVGVGNGLMKLGFRALPFAYDRLVGPLYRLLAIGRTPVAPHDGNVFTPVAGHEGLRGDDSELVGAGAGSGSSGEG